jgi:hypothetical protein
MTSTGVFTAVPASCTLPENRLLRVEFTTFRVRGALAAREATERIELPPATLRSPYDWASEVPAVTAVAELRLNGSANMTLYYGLEPSADSLRHFVRCKMRSKGSQQVCNCYHRAFAFVNTVAGLEEEPFDTQGENTRGS